MGMKEIPEVTFLNNDQQEDIKSLERLRISSSIDDLGTPQVCDFDSWDLRGRCGEPRGKMTLSPRRIPWKLVLKIKPMAFSFSLDLMPSEKSRVQDFLDKVLDRCWSCDGHPGGEMELLQKYQQILQQ